MRPSVPRLTAALTLVVVAALTVGLVGAIDDGRAAPSVEPSNLTTEHVPPSVAQPANTSSYLRVPGDDLESASYGTVGIDVPGGLAMDRDRLAVRLTTDAFAERFGRISSTENRTAAVAGALDDLDAIVERAQRRQQTALRQYNRGEIDARLFVRTLGRSDATAVAVRGAVERVRERANDPLDYSPGRRLETRFENTEPALSTLDGRIREMFVNAITGGRQAGSTVYIETGRQDVVLATVFDDTYIRESYIGQSYAPSFDSNASAANERIQDLYTWGFLAENYVSVPSIEPVGNTSVFRADVTHRQGRFTIYFDANTSGVFREVQAKRLVDARPRRRQTATNGSLRLTINATHDTGPMQVNVADNATGGPLNATVFVNDERVGVTGGDGQLWTVDARDTARVRVVTADANASTFVYGSN